MAELEWPGEVEEGIRQLASMHRRVLDGEEIDPDCVLGVIGAIESGSWFYTGAHWAALLDLYIERFEVLDHPQVLVTIAVDAGLWCEWNAAELARLVHEVVSRSKSYDNASEFAYWMIYCREDRNAACIPAALEAARLRGRDDAAAMRALFLERGFIKEDD